MGKSTCASAPKSPKTVPRIHRLCRLSLDWMRFQSSIRRMPVPNCVALCLALLAFISSSIAATPASQPAADFEKEIKPLLAEYCNKCHSTEKQKGDLDLERFTTAESL